MHILSTRRSSQNAAERLVSDSQARAEVTNTNGTGRKGSRSVRGVMSAAKAVDYAEWLHVSRATILQLDDERQAVPVLKRTDAVVHAAPAIQKHAYDSAHPPVFRSCHQSNGRGPLVDTDA